MFELYDALRTASRKERQAIAARVVGAMTTETTGQANTALFETYRKLAYETSESEHSFWRAADSARTGQLMQSASAQVVEKVPRTGGFLRAIARSPQAASAIDAGCGATAVLSLGLAVYHPKAEILAYEINFSSARCAAAMLELMGYADRVDVITGDIMQFRLPKVDLAVTETFNRGLFIEPGCAITRRLATCADRILPARASISAREGYESSDVNWQLAGSVDFRSTNGNVSGKFVSSLTGNHPVYVFAEYFDPEGMPIVTGLGSDEITDERYIGALDIPSQGDQIHFAYPAGAIFPDRATSLWVEPSQT